MLLCAIVVSNKKGHTMTDDKLLTTKEAAFRLGISAGMLNKARVADDGRMQIAYVKLTDGAIRYKASDLDAFIETHRVQPKRPVE